MTNLRSLFLLLTLYASALFAQQVPIGQWRDQLPFYLSNSVTDAGSRIYASTPYALFYLNKEDNSTGRITKISGLSDIGISTINYSKEYQTLVVAYSNANIDLIKGNRIINISDIKRKQILGNKTINNIFFIGKDAYLACGFGIVVLDISKEEIRETYYIGAEGSQVNVLAINMDASDSLFAASEKGIYKAWLKDPNLANFASWHKDSRIDTTATYNTITSFAGKIFVSKRTATNIADTIYSFSNGAWSRVDRDGYYTVKKLRSTSDYLVISYSYFVVILDPAMEVFTTIWDYQPGSPYPLDAIADSDGKFWVSDNYSGMIGYDKQTGYFTHINLGGPLSSMAFSMTGLNNDIYIAPGGMNSSYGPIYNQPQIYHFDNTNWKNLTAFNNPVLGQAYDIVSIAANPLNPKQVFAGSYGKGVIELYNDSAINRYSEKNSTLKHHTASDTADIRVGGVTVDNQGRLWAVNSGNNTCISMKNGSKWTGYTIPIVNETDLGRILIDKHGQAWVQMRYGNMNPNSLLVFYDNNTPDNPADDQSKLLNSTVGLGAIPGNNVYSMAEDLKGEIWIGTEKGIAVFYSPENVFSGLNFDCQRILVTQGGYVQYLLENETVTAIAVDGANRKWVGTDRGGVFLFSEDGTKQIHHFTAEDSPLLSDRIVCIALNQDGEVYFGTDKGVISYRASATPADDTFGDVYAFPNPVKPDYDGYIAIKGLVNNAQVRITDVNNVLVYSTRAEGGQAIWDGKNFDGRKVRTGVYLVFAADDTATEKVVTKILFVN